MDYKEVRINTEIGLNNKFINFKLEQEFDFINILSLKLTQSDSYSIFNADYGCITGRVIANGGVGVPNVKISVFIPLSEEDEQNDNIRSIYPYKTPEDVNLQGYKYNLLPRVSQISPYISNFSNEFNIGYTPKTPVGTFPTKEEVLTNDLLLDVYKKYYKYTTVTNESGDYMIFGVPVGRHILHMSADITDIGKFSMTPATIVKLLGASPDLFDDNGTKIRKTTDLDDIPNIQIQNIAVDVRPFWGDSENFEIGITRQDFKLKTRLISTFTVFGSMTTMGEDGLWGISKSDNCGGIFQDNQCLFYTINNNDNLGYSASTFRLPIPKAEIYTIRNSVNEEKILSGDYNINNDIIKLSKSEYVEYIDNGVFAYVIPCNRKKIITNEFGLEEEVSNDNPNGIFSEFNGYFLMDSEDLPIGGNTDRDGLNRPRGPFIKLRGKFKIPQNHGSQGDYLKIDDSSSSPNNIRWIKKNRKFFTGEYYSVAQFLPVAYGFDGDELVNSALNRPKNNTLGIIQSTELYVDNEENTGSKVVTTDFPHNTGDVIPDKFFGSQWLNMSLFQIQFGASDRAADKRVRAAKTLVEGSENSSMYFLTDNIQNLGGGRFNSKGFLTAKFHYFDFINIKRDDIVKMGSTNKKIFRSIDDNLNTDSTYKYGSNETLVQTIPSNEGGNIIAKDFTNNRGAFVYKGLFESDSIQFLINLNLV